MDNKPLYEWVSTGWHGTYRSYWQELFWVVGVGFHPHVVLGIGEKFYISSDVRECVHDGNIGPFDTAEQAQCVAEMLMLQGA